MKSLFCVPPGIRFKFLLFLLGSLLFAGSGAQAADLQHDDPVHAASTVDSGPVFLPPVRALISPHGAHLEDVRESELQHLEGRPAIVFTIPANASNLQLNVLGKTIARWISEPVILKAASQHSTSRGRLENERKNLSAQLATAQARIDVWKMQTPSSSAQDLGERQTLMEHALPALVQFSENLQHRLKLVERELAEMPAAGEIGKKITVFLTGDNIREERARIEYSYNLPSCGWDAIYEFNARPDGQKGDIVDVRLMAEVWQYTGIDWKDTEITLVTRGSGPREPYPLERWVIGEQPAPQPRAATLSAKSAKDTREAVTTNLDVAPPMAHVTGNADTVYASWNLSVKGLPEGKSRLQIISDAWEAPLQWLARPVRGDSRVWLYAKYSLPPNQGWPDGNAQYSVDGQSVGDGYFVPQGTEATLYFGADPRVQIRTTTDSSKQGETGIINTNRTWTWAWTYTLTNTHNTPVKVKVERPAPIITHEDVQVSYNDKPVSVKDEKEHMVYWEVEVPANGKSEIEHSVTVTSPVKLQLLPDVP